MSPQREVQLMQAVASAYESPVLEMARQMSIRHYGAIENALDFKQAFALAHRKEVEEMEVELQKLSEENDRLRKTIAMMEGK